MFKDFFGRSWSSADSVNPVTLPHARCSAVLCAFFLLVPTVFPARAQQPLPPAAQDSQGSLPAQPGPPRGMDNGPEPPRQMLEQQALARDRLRQKTIVADSDRLLLLAQQLHAAVAKSRNDQLSINVVKTSEQIEKLAKSVKELMRGY